MSVENHEQAVEGQTVIELHNGEFMAVKDSEVDATLKRLNESVREQIKHAAVYSRSGLSPEEVEQTLSSLLEAK